MTVQTSKPQPLLVNRDEAVHMLGISPRTLYLLTKNGEIPSLLLGHACCYSVKAIEQFIEKQLTATS